MDYSVGVDIGGTKINFALLKNWKKEKTKKVMTPQTKEEIVAVVEKNIRILTEDVSDSEIVGVGIGVPSLLDKKKEKILAPPNLKTLTGFSLAKFIEKDIGIKTVLENDSNCFALAEAMIGAGKGCSIIVGITVGTGIGGGIVFKRGNEYEIYEGAFGRAGEIGHMVFDYRGFDCNCGSKGCFEGYASEKFFKRRTSLSSIEIEKKAKKGSKKAKYLYREFARNLADGLASVINILDPEVIVIGGGFSKASSLILKPLREELEERVFLTESKKFAKIRITKLGEFAGAIGAGLLFKNKN